MKKLLYLFISLAFTAVSFAQVQIVSVDTTGESCEGADDGRIFITTTSGALPITYFVSGGSFNATIIQNFDTLTVKNLPAQNYVVVAQDINGDFDFKSFDISAGRAISTPIITSNAPLCLNNILTFSAASDAGASYQWTGPNSFTSTNQSFFITNVTAANAGNYDVYATGLGKQSKVCSSAVATKNVVISPVPNSSFTISKASPCVNENITLTFTGSAQSGALYDWNPAGGNISGPDNLKTVRWSTSGPKNVTLQVSNNGCLSTTTTRLVNVVNQPQAVISGIDTICIGQSSNLTITFTGTAPWIYTYNNAGTPATINTSNNPATIVVSPSVTTNYFGTSINDAQCAGVPTGLATINVNSAPSASIKDTTIAVCNGSSTTIPISFSGTAPFNYQYTDGTTTFSGTSNTISSSITVNPSVSTTYSLVSVTDGICSGTVSGTSVINVSPSPTSTFTIPSTSCLNSDVTVTYTGSASPTASYNWNFGGGVVVSGSGQGPHQIRWLTTGPKTVRLTVSENGCTSSQTTNNITILTRPDVRLITSNQSICAGNSVTLSFLSSGTAPYTYQFTDGTTTFSRTTSSVLSTSLLSPSTTSTYSIVSVGDANCTNGTFSGTTVVTVRPVPTSTFSVSPAGLCTNQAATITYTGTGNAGATYNWTFAGGTPASATGQGPHNVSWSAPGTNNVSLSVVQSSCPSTVTTTPVTVINQPTATISGANTICSGNSTNLSVSFTGTAPYNFTYSDGSTSTSVTTSSNPHVIAVSPATTRTYTLTAFNDNNCNGTFGGSAAITVNPTPTLTTSTTQNVCSGLTSNIALISNPTGASFSWIIGTITGSVTGGIAGSGNTIAQTLTGTGTIQYIVTPTSGSCVGNPTTITVTVSPIPTLTTATTANVCSGNNANISLTSSPSGATFAWTLGAITGSVSGASNGSGSTISQVLTGNGTVDYLVTPTLGSCVGSTSTITVTVSPTPTVTTSTTSSICSGDVTSISLTSNPSGATFNWTIGAITGVVSGATSGSGNSIAQTLTGNGTVAYQVTPTIGSCAGTTTNIIVTVNPSPVLTTSTSQTACSGNVTNIALTSNPLGAIFTWTIGTITGTASGAIAGSGSTIAQTLNGVGTIEYIVTPTIGTCVGIPTIITVSVSNSSTVTTPNTAIVCSGNTSNIALTSSPSGASFSWVIGTVTGSASGASSGSGSVIAQTLTGSGTIQYIVTPSFGSCTGTPLTITVTVSPLPNMTVATTGSLCSGATTNIPLSSSPSGSTFAWTIGTITGIVTGGSAGGGNNISQTLTGNGTVEYIVTPTRNGCAGNSRTITITVLPTPAVTTSSTFSICSGNSTNIPLTSNPVGATFAWTIGTITGTASGAIAGSGTNINQVLTGTGSIAYLVTPTLGTCVGTTTTITVNVSGPPVLSSSTTNTICSGGTTSINLTSVPSGASFNWTTGLITGTVSGFSSGSGTAINQTLNGLGTVDYLVTPSFGSCVGSTSTITVTVTNPPVLTSPTTYSICEGNTTAISLTSNPTGASFSWTVGVVTGTASGAANGTGSSINQTLTGSGTVEYLVTPSITGCSGAATSIIVTVNPGPTVSTASSTNICSGSQTNLLLVSNPIGASFTYTTSLSGGTVTGFSNGSGSPIQQTLTGNGTVDYLVTPTLAGCIGTPSTISVNVNDGVIASTSSSTNICSGGQTNLVLTSTPAGATYSYTTSSTGTVAGFSNGIGSPIQQTLVGNGTVTYLVTPSLGACLGTPLSITVTVDPPSTVSTVSPTSICTGAQTNLVLTSSPVGATFNYTTSSTGTVSGFSDGSGSPIQQTLTGTGTVTYAVTPSFGGCLGTTSNIVVNVNPPPDASFIVPPACVNTNTSIQYFGSAPPSATYNWNFGGATVVPPGTGIGPHSVSWSTPGNKTVTLQVTENGCTSSLNSVVVAVNSAPDVTISGDTTLCQGGSPILYFNFNGIAPYDFTYSNGSNNFPTNSPSDSYADLVPTPPGLGTTTYQVTSLTDASGCTGTFTGTAVVNVGNAPTASIIGDTSVCTGSPAFVRIRFNGVAPFSYTYDDGSGPISASTNNNVEVINIASVAAGVTYTLSNVKDANCDAIISKSTAVMSITPGPDASFIVPPACINTNTSIQYFGSAPPSAIYNWNFGGATVVPPGTGIGPHSVSWSTPGNKTVTLQVTENGCTSSLNSVVVAVNSAPDVTISGDTTLCQGGSPVLYFNFNGIAPYDFTYSDGSNNFPTNSATDSYADLVPTSPGLGATTYQVTSLTDASGCTGTFTGAAVVNVIAAPTASITNDTTICEGADAFVRFNFSGLAPFTYTYNDGVKDSTVTTNNLVEIVNIPAVLANVTYTLVAVSDVNCDAIITSNTATINIVTKPVAAFDATNPIVACLNNDVTFTYTGAPVTSYQWGFDNPTTISDPDLTTAGPYAASWNTLGVKNIYLIVSDGSCVSDTAKLALTIQNAPTVVVTGDTTICSGNFAILKVAFTGTPIWILEWIDEQGTPKSKDFTVANDTIMVNPLSTYNYEFSQVTDAALCPNTIIPSKVNVNVEDTPTPDFSVSPPVSCGNSDVLVKYQSVIDPEMKFVWDFDGQSSLNPTGNSQEYNVQWNTSGIKNLQVTVTDTLSGCSASVGNSVTINPIVSATLSGNDTVCSGTSASKIQVDFTGVKPWIFTYNVNGSPVTDTADVTPYLIPTNPTVNSTYSLVSVIDSNNCSGNVSGTSDVIVKLLPDATIRKSEVICLGDTVGLQALLKVGTPSWTLVYSDSSSLGINIDTLNSNSIVDSIFVSPTVYTAYKVISVTDASGCTALLNDEQPPTVSVDSLPIASFVVSPSAICLDQDVTITFTGDVLFSPSYSWHFDNNTLPLDSTLVGPHIAQYNTTGNKTIRLILKDNATGCLSDTAFGNVLIQGAPTAVISGDTTICSGTQAFIKVVSTGTAPFTVNFNDESGPSQVTLSNLTDYISVSPTSQFIYALDSIKDNLGCINSNIPGSVQVDVNPSPLAVIAVTQDAICIGDTIIAQFKEDLTNIKLGWDFSGGDSIRNSVDIYDVSWTTSGLKPITVIATNTINGCSGSATKLVEVYPNPVATITGNDTVCNGVNASNIIINFTSGTKPWIFSYDDGSIKQDTAYSSPYVFNVSPSDTTVYSLISVSDSNSCTNIATGTATLVVRPTPEFEFSQSQSICLGDQAPLVGNLKIGIPNWSLIYQDSSSNGIVQDTVLFTKNIDTFFVSPIVTTKYKVVRGFDASGCDAIYDDEQSSPIIIVSPKPSTTFNITPGKCLADTIIATYTGTSPSANFTWDFGGGSSAKPINDVGPHSLLYPNSGLKKVKLTVEENGCSVTDSAVTNINPSPTATLINNGLSTVCAGDNVVLDLTFTAGVPPFKYTYKEGNTTKTDSTVNSVANIASNPIDTIVFRLLTIQDATCSNISNDSVVVNVKPLPTISFTGLASNYCSSQGEITFSSNRLDTFRIAPATVGFTNLVGLGQGKFNPTAAGIGLYTISQTHIGANGCTNTRNQDVLVDTPPTSADFDFEPLYCAGVDTVLFPSTNFGVFTIVPATGLAFNDSTGSIFPIQSTLGTYTITNTVDGGACASVSASDIVVIYPQAGLPIITNLADTLSCSQDSSVITYKLTPVTGNTYEWNVFGGTIKGDSILDSVIVKWNKLSFQKSISVVASNKFCFDTSSFAVYVDTIVIDVRYVTDSIGNDNVIQLNWLAASSVNPNDSVFIYRRTNLPDLGPWETIAKVPMSVSFVNYIDTTNTLLTGLISYEYRVGAINACGDTLFSAAHRTIVTKVTGNEDKGQVYLDYNSYQPWTPKEYQIWRQLDNETEFTLYQTVYNLDSVLTFNNATDDGFNQCYRVLAIRDILTNVRTDSSWSNIACVNFKNKVKIYNTFTPNSNDVNSTFYVDNIALYPDNEVYIFNRWGARVYYRRAYNNDWDGGGLPSGTYFYVVRVEGDEYKGYVFIAR